jgi:hypothetical protein
MLGRIPSWPGLACLADYLTNFETLAAPLLPFGEGERPCNQGIALPRIMESPYYDGFLWFAHYHCLAGYVQ